MDFGLVDMSLVCSSSAPSAPNNGGGLFALDGTREADEDNNGKQRFCGFGPLKQDRAANVNEDDFRGFNKISKISSVERDDCYLPNGHQQMLLSFSSPTSQYMPLPYGYGSSGMLNMQQGVVVSGVRGPFTPSQWMELEHQALIYKYISANVPIPSYLLNPIHKAFESVRFLGYPGMRSGGLGWGGFHVGYGSTDPEPGRCRRTDGKKWRCSRDAVADQKYCERHINRGRHRSRKPVEGQSAPHSVPSGPTPAVTGAKPATSSTGAVLSHHPHQLGCNNTNHHRSGIPTINRYISDKQNADETPMHKKAAPLEKDNLLSSVSSTKQHPNEPEFGLVCSDSLLNPLDQSSSLVTFKSYNNNQNPPEKPHHPLRKFMDSWPENQLDGTHLSISIDSPSRELEMGLGLGPAHQRQMGWVPISWEPAVGGPLGEVLHSREVAKPLPPPLPPPLSLVGSWEGSSSSSPRTGGSSPTGVLQKGPFGSMSNSSAGSSPRAGACSRLFGLGHAGPSMPTL